MTELFDATQKLFKNDSLTDASKLLEILKGEGIIIEVNSRLTCLYVEYRELYSDFSGSREELNKIGVQIGGFKVDTQQNVVRVWFVKL